MGTNHRRKPNRLIDIHRLRSLFFIAAVTPPYRLHENSSIRDRVQLPSYSNAGFAQHTQHQNVYGITITAEFAQLCIHLTVWSIVRINHTNLQTHRNLHHLRPKKTRISILWKKKHHSRDMGRPSSCLFNISKIISKQNSFVG